MKTHRNLDTRLGDLNTQLIAMAGYVEQAIEAATAAWRSRAIEKVEVVFAIEEQVNQLHMQVDATCIRLLALQQPLAADLRLVVASIKINTDLERMVDLAVNIAQNTEYYLKSPQLILVDDLSQMSDEVRTMVREVLDSFVKTDLALANEVLKRDDKVDAFKRKIFQDVLAYVKKDASAVEQGLNVILIAKNLECIGDHATNIAEDVIYTVSGRDVRHSEKK